MKNETEKICTGCGRSSLNPIEEQYTACCPDNNYVIMSNKTKQTSVEWLVKQLPLIQQEGLRDVIEEAKAQERWQSIRILTKYHNSLFLLPLKDGEAESIYNHIVDTNKMVTAVDWFKKELENYGSNSHWSLDWNTFDELCQQAKEMEKEMTIKIYNDYENYLEETFKHQNGGQAAILSFREFYNLTYGGNK